ncbi:MAG: hypothetical protein R3B48_27350 [Kofleriaceae bacterium]
MRSFLVCWIGLWWCAAPAAAERRVTAGLESALELDTNPRRAEGSESSIDQAKTLTRVAGRLEVAESDVAGGALIGVGSAQVRAGLEEGTSSESLALLSLDSQWLREVRDGEVRIGPRISFRDAEPLAEDAEDRAYRSASADLSGVLLGPDARVMVSAGPRVFQYPDNDASSWRGGGAAVRGDFSLWSGGDADEQSLELVALAAVEQRAYYARAYTNGCAPGQRVTEACFLVTPRRRGDRMHQASARLIYTGTIVASLEYQITVVDSNSFGRSWIGQRTRAALTAPVGPAFLTGIATAQLDQYPDGLLVARDPSNGLFDTLEDDNRSSLEARLAIPLGRSSVSLEGRLATWRELSGDVTYGRSLASLGLVWVK